MIKLYKRDSAGIRYWQAWKDRHKVVIHWGAVGNRGETREIQLQHDERASEVMKRESENPRSRGYRKISDEKHASLLVQYKIQGWGSEDDLLKREKVEGILNETLGWTGNGVCDGGDIGSGTINIFCYVVEPNLAIDPIIGALRQERLSEGAIIAMRGPDEEDYRVLWPENFDGEFELQV
jgi:hypothetical protein